MAATSTKKTPRHKAKPRIDLEMRAKGYVTAAEVADALGVTLPSVHRKMDEGAIAGVVVPSIGSTYQRRYIDPVALLASLDAFPQATRSRVAALVKLVKSS